MLMGMVVLMAFVFVGVRSLSSFRLGVVLEGIGRTQCFAFQARRGEPNSYQHGLQLPDRAAARGKTSAVRPENDSPHLMVGGLLAGVKPASKAIA
jgi:hypothetical protein